MEGSDLTANDQESRQPNQPHEVTSVRCFSPAPASEQGGEKSTSPAPPDLSLAHLDQAVLSIAPPMDSTVSSATSDGSHASLYAEVWQYVGTAWKEVYHFNNGLEFDCLSARPESSYWSRLHLPSTSLKALQRLRDALQLPKAIQLDACSGTSRSLVFTSLYEQAASVLDAMGENEISRSEIQRILETRGGKPVSGVAEVPRDDETASMNSEALVAPLDETQAVDISVCPLPHCPKDMPPIVAFARLSNPVSLRPDSEDKTRAPSVRLAALVLCSARGQVCSAQLGREIGRALAISCMDEEFARVACTCETPIELLDYLDSYFSSLTLVPTVYMLAASPSKMPTEEMKDSVKMMGRLELGYMLTDSMVDGIERRIRKRRRIPALKQSAGKLHYCRHDRDKHPWDRRRRYFVEVHERKQSTQTWCVTRRLWQGLGVQIDVDTAVETSPQLPNVSEQALEALKQVFRPECIGLDVASENVPTMIDAVLHQLACAGLTKANGADDIAVALRKWAELRHPTKANLELAAKADDGEQPVTVETEPVSPMLSAGSKQVPPRPGDEACHIIVVASNAMPQKQGVIGACVRFASPLASGFTPTGSHAGSLARFLIVVAGPVNARAELLALTEAFGALALDEDLMGDLTLAESGPGFCEAIELWLADLTVVSRTQVKRNKGTLSRFSGRFQKHLMTPVTAEETEAKEIPLSAVTSNESDERISFIKKKETMTCQQRTKWIVGKMQKYSIPLCTGVTLAMIWENAHADSYHDFTHSTFWKDAEIFGHPLNLHFLVNDIFMCFFFGLAMKEVAEALLPGGSLNPLSRAINPLFATAGGIFVPIAVYCVCILILDGAGSFSDTMCDVPDAASDDHRRLGGGASSSAGSGVQELCPMSSIMKGWGVPTATDISLAWMFALLVFGAGHPCINFLLLLAIVDDAIGMIIIAVFYPNPEKPVEPVFLLFTLGSVFVGLALRYLHFHHWQVYIFIAGPLSWFGLIKAHVHPALALVCVVPIMPAKAHRPKKAHMSNPIFRWCANLMQSCSRISCFRSGKSAGSSDAAADAAAAAIAAQFGDVSEEQRAKAVRRASDLMRSQHHAPLHAFEESLKLPVDLGMFFFGVANAGVQFGSVGGVTIAVVAALFAGKTFGIAGFGLFAQCIGFPLPSGIGVADLFAASALGGIGLTVALFVANQAFVDNGLKGQAKMGAVISILCAALAWFIKHFCDRKKPDTDDDIMDVTDYEDMETTTVEDSDGEPLKGTTVPAAENGEDDDFIVDSLLEDILHTMWMKHEYERHGTEMPIETNRRRSISKASQDHRGSRSSMGSMNSFRPMRGSLRLSSKELDRGSSMNMNGRDGPRRCYSRESTGGMGSSWAWRSGSRSNSEQIPRSSNGLPAQAWGPRSDQPKGTAPPALSVNGDAQNPACGRESPTLLTLSEVGQSTTPSPPAPETKIQSPRMLS